MKGFNSQPREGGWVSYVKLPVPCSRFNSQPREGGWLAELAVQGAAVVSTHSRAKAAG